MGPRKIQSTWEPTGTEVSMQSSQPDFVGGGQGAAGLLVGAGLTWANKSAQAPPSPQDHWGPLAGSVGG